MCPGLAENRQAPSTVVPLTPRERGIRGWREIHRQPGVKSPTVTCSGSGSASHQGIPEPLPGLEPQRAGPVAAFPSTGPPLQELSGIGCPRSLPSSAISSTALPLSADTIPDRMQRRSRQCAAGHPHGSDASTGVRVFSFVRAALAVRLGGSDRQRDERIAPSLNQAADVGTGCSTEKPHGGSLD